MEELNKTIISVCLKIAKRGEGAIIVLGSADYNPLVKQIVPKFSVIENPKLLESLALNDGACIVDKFGILQAYGVMLKVSKLEILKNFGTRHNSAINVSMKEGNRVYVVSEEEQKVRIYVSGKLILEIDGRTKGIENKTNEISNLLESAGFGTLSILGASALIPTLGLALIPGVILFGGTHYIINTIKNWEKGK